MVKDIIYDESEISIAANQLINYVDFLGQCIDEYISALNELKTKGIEDDKICANVEELINEISTYKSKIVNVGQNLKSAMNEGVNGIVFADKCKFYSNMTDKIRTDLARFL